MQVEVVTIGTELLAGEIVDTNAAWLMARFEDLGLRVHCHQTVPDEEATIAEALEVAAGRATLLVLTGGLGPTDDDRTAEAVARWAGVETVLHPEAEALVRAALARFGATVTERQLRQARLPRGARPLSNPKGTAPGFHLRRRDRDLFVLPGPPEELRPMAEAHLLPWVRARRAGAHYATEVLRCYGRGESVLSDLVAGSGIDLTGIELGWRFSFPEVLLRVRAEAETEEGARARLEEALGALEQALSPWCYARGEQSLAAVVGGLLREAERTLAFAESCTGGLLSTLVTDVPGASAYFLGAVVSYANEVKAEVLGVDASILRTHGAVSPECARAMARGARARLGADLAVAVTGIAGPSGGTKEKPVGLVHFALADAEGVVHKRRIFPGDRAQVRRAAAYFGLDLVRRRLTGRLEVRG
ncbi:MAG: competence/damage-inducible protein A [Deltaproteobacteria bacterium]|nr:MAG: competence/damage-inducible protein A [Deltaproteobacteria bacterium]